jgi:hypothetical protein
MMDVKTGMPVYRPKPAGPQMASLPVPPTTVMLPVPTGTTVIVPVPTGTTSSGKPNVCKPTTTSYSPPQNVCNPKPQNVCNPKPQNVCNPTAPPKSSPISLKPKPGDSPMGTSPKPSTGALTLKPNPNGAKVASLNPCNTKKTVQACESKPPFLPWGGQGSAMVTVSGGMPCGIGWHDTGATILDSMSVTSQPAHGSLQPKDQHMIIFTPAPGYKGQDSFILSMREHNGGRRATLAVKVSVTIR